MVIAGELASLGAELDALEEDAGEVFVEQTFAVGAEGGVVPDLVFDVQTNEPAIQEVVVNRFDQLAFAAKGEQDLQQQGFQQHLWRDRGATTAGIHRFELAAHRRQQRINHGAQFAQRVSRWHSLFKADVAEHRPLEVWVASHRLALGCTPMASDRTGRDMRRRGIFQRPVKPQHSRVGLPHAEREPAKGGKTGKGSPEFAQKPGKLTQKTEIAICILSSATVFGSCGELNASADLTGFAGVALHF